MNRILSVFLLLAFAALALAADGPTINVNEQLQQWRDYYGQRDAWPKAHGWKPFKRYEWDAIQRGWPTGEIPVNGLWEAFQQRGRMPQTLDETWVNLGPYNHSGRTRVIRFHPGNPTIMYAGAVGGGLWKSTNSGNSWFPITEQLPNIAVGSFEIDVTNPQVMYLGTGEGYYNSDGIAGIGLLKSTDGGLSWNTTGLAYPYSQGKAILKINIDPRNGQIVFASTNDGLYRSVNGGSTFTLVRSGDIKELKRDPQELDNMLCAAGNPWGSGTNGIYRSTDNGLTWIRVTGGLPPVNQIGRVVLDFFQSNSQVVYAGICGTFELNGSQMIGIFRSVDNGENWTQMSPGGINHYAGQGWYDMAIAVHPTQSNMVFSSGLDLWKSMNSGLGWTQKSWWYYNYGHPNFIHADHHEIVFHPTSENELWSVTDGGIFRSTNLGETWTEQNTGYVTFQYYAMGNATLDTALAYGGTQDNGTFRWNGDPNQQAVNGGDGGYCVVDYTDDNVVYAEYQMGYRRRSDDGAVNFVDINAGIQGDGAWVTPMVLDPFEHNTIYTTTASSTPRVWKSTTRGSGNWTVVGNPVGATNQVLEVSTLVPNRLYLGSNSAVYRSDNGGNWISVTGNLPGQWVTRVVPDRFNPDGVYVTLSGFGSGHVWKSTQAGGSWVNISGNLPDVPTNDLVVDLAEPSTLYAGTDIGVYRTTDGGATWAVFGQGLPAVRVDDMDMQVATGVLRIATHGRGMWEVPTGSVSTTMFFPNGGELFAPGTGITLRWGGVSLGGELRIDLNRNYPSGEWETLFASTANDGLENWTVSGAPSDHVRFRIQHLSQPTQSDTSDADSRIVNPGLRMLRPNGGETVFSGSRDTIRFERILATDVCKVELNLDYPGGTWTELATDLTTDYFIWTVQLPGSQQARVRVTSLERPELNDISDADFTLRAPVMTMIAPVGGEQIPLGMPYLVQWSAPEHQASVRISLNRAYPTGAWELISPSTPNDGSHAWVPTGQPSMHCRVRVAAIFDPNQTFAESPEDFELGTAAAEVPAGLPAAFELSEPYPNPFNPLTTVELALPSHAHVVAAVFNRLGQQVDLLADADLPAGRHTLTFNGRDLSSGIYFIRVNAATETRIVKAVLMK